MGESGKSVEGKKDKQRDRKKRNRPTDGKRKTDNIEMEKNKETK